MKQPLWTDDESCLNRCAELAEIARSRGESPVGSLIVVAGGIVGVGIEAGKIMQDITCHAEVEAIRQAVKTQGKDLSAATLYTTHEPCILCSYVIRHHRIGRVVIRHAVEHIGGATSAFPVLTTDKVDIWGVPPVVDFV
jgi:tRNA(adenine34) deaminase